MITPELAQVIYAFLDRLKIRAPEAEAMAAARAELRKIIQEGAKDAAVQ